jgi:uncharacterized protein
MVRPKKCRLVDAVPGVTYFKPAGVPLRFLDEVHLSVEEAESVRLKDLKGLQQVEAAQKMGVSRATFQRVLSSARKKVADALLNGKAIRIEGGSFQLAIPRFPCQDDQSGTGVAPTAQPPVRCHVCEDPGRDSEPGSECLPGNEK